MTAARRIGITILPEYFQSEGVEAVLDNVIRRAGANAVATSPYVMELADEASGNREPPIDAGAGKVRLLDRPLWGHRELWMRTAPSFEPERRLYEGLTYEPPPTEPLTRDQGPLVQQFIEAAHARGLKVYFQVQAAIPPGYRVQFGGPRDEDQPRLPSGEIPGRRVANNASLASPAVLDYQRALIQDLHQAYPQIDGLRFDWPEYPPYLIDSAFLDFSPHVERVAADAGLDFSRMREDASRLYAKLHGGLEPADLEHYLQNVRATDHPLMTLLEEHPGVRDMLRLKAQLSSTLLAGFRETMTAVGGSQWELGATAFPPPWSKVSGMDFAGNARHVDSLSVKLYGMHWAMMLRFYGDQLLAANPQLDAADLGPVLASLLDIADEGAPPASVLDYHYPEPHEPHPIGAAPQQRKIRAAQQAAGSTPVHALAHGYGPVDDFRKRVAIAWQGSEHGLWVNRYGYLSDEKLDAIGDVTRAAGHAAR